MRAVVIYDCYQVPFCQLTGRGVIDGQRRVNSNTETSWRGFGSRSR
jgi:hypothetical protein